PWNSVSVVAGTGHIATVKAAIWKTSPEKVVGVRKAWAEKHPEALSALLRALHHAARWCEDPANRGELAALMAQPSFLGVSPALQMPILTGHLALGGGAELTVEDFFLPFGKAANFPWKSHALWFYTQMVRWGQIKHSAAHMALARDAYRPDLYRAALKPLGVALPGANAKVEGALTAATPVGSAGASLVLGPDGFFDGRIFDPDRIDDYLAIRDWAMPTS
ncbi:ABC transporter substrate-binding protein, partial [Mesorhizobium sp.]